MSGGPPQGGPRRELPPMQGPACARPGHGASDVPAAPRGGVAGTPPEPGGSKSPSAEWHARLGPLDFSVGVRHFELRGVFPEQPAALRAGADAAPRADPPPAGRIRAAEDGVPDRESEGRVAD